MNSASNNNCVSSICCTKNNENISNVKSKLLVRGNNNQIRKRYFSKLGIHAGCSIPVVISENNKGFCNPSRNQYHQNITKKEQQVDDCQSSSIIAYEREQHPRDTSKVCPCYSIKSCIGEATTRRRRPISISRVRFHPRKFVVKIPSHSDYPDEIKKQLWNSIDEIDENKKRNTIEFIADGCDWRTVKEEQDMIFDSISGEHIHPAHYQILLDSWLQQQQTQEMNDSCTITKMCATTERYLQPIATKKSLHTGTTQAESTEQVITKKVETTAMTSNTRQNNQNEARKTQQIISHVGTVNGTNKSNYHYREPRNRHDHKYRQNESSGYNSKNLVTKTDNKARRRFKKDPTKRPRGAYAYQYCNIVAGASLTRFADT